jgi:hypothetical protein
MTEPERQVTLRLTEGITVNGDKDLLRVVMENSYSIISSAY